MMSEKLLLDDKPLLILPKLAIRVGLNESIVLQQIHYWLQKSKHEHKGYVWIYNTYDEWVEQFPWWSKATIRRIITKLENEKILVTDNFNELKIDKTKWYRIDYKVLEGVSSPCAQNEQSKCSNRAVDVSNMNTPLPEITTENTTDITTTNNSMRRGESDGVPTTDPLSGDSIQTDVEEISQTPDFVTEILDYFIQLRAQGFNYSPNDLTAAKELLTANVPIESAKTWMRECFENYKPKHPRDKINGLTYCIGYILDKHTMSQQLSKEGENEQTIFKNRRSVRGSGNEKKTYDQVMRELQSDRDAWE